MALPKKVTDRAPRVRVLRQHQLHFEHAGPGGAVQKSPIVNISTSGAALLKSPGARWPAAGETLRGRIVATHARQPTELGVEIRIAHLTGQLIGVEFTRECASEAAKFVTDYLRLELEVLRLLETPQKMLKPDPHGNPRWLHGRHGFELYWVTELCEVKSFQIAFFNHYLEGAPDKRLRYGLVMEEKAAGKPRPRSEALIRWQMRIPDEVIELALRFLDSIRQIDALERAELVEAFQKSAALKEKEK